MRRTVFVLSMVVSFALCAVGALAADGADAKGKIDYNRQIRPLLSNHCFKCHGPDAAERKGELRLDQREAALKPAESGVVSIVAGMADKSELVKRIFSNDPDQ